MICSSQQNHRNCSPTAALPAACFAGTSHSQGSPALKETDVRGEGGSLPQDGEKQFPRQRQGVQLLTKDASGAERVLPNPSLAVPGKAPGKLLRGGWETGRGRSPAGTGAPQKLLSAAPKPGSDEGWKVRSPSSLGESFSRLKSLAGFGLGKGEEEQSL